MVPLVFENCGNIKEAKLNITPNKVNIKYGLNGLGKTTLGKTLYGSIIEDNNLLERYIPYGANNTPTVYHENLKSALYFDEEYVDNYLFKEDLINKSFEIVVKTPDYDNQIKEINNSFSDLVSEIQSENVVSASSELKLLTESIKFNAKNEFVASSTFGKGIKKINIENLIDPSVEIYKSLITASNNFSWIDWFKSGKQYVLNDNCPFCLNNLPIDFDNRYTSVVGSFSKTDLKNSAESNEKLAKLRVFVDKKTADQILNEQNSGNISEETKRLIKANLDVLSIEKAKLDAIQNLDPLTLVDLSKDDLNARFESYKLTEIVFKNISSELHLKIIKINDKLSEVISKIDTLNKQISILRSTLSKNIKKVSSFVNDFLVISGIPYKIEVIVNGHGNAKTVLKPIDNDFEIYEPKKSLSYGELNSLSLVLFCVEAINKKPDLIILDDPVSSFDGNKKYAIMHQLFSSSIDKNLRGMTVLMFSHDFTPVIDFIYNNHPTKNESEAWYLYNKEGYISESEIKKSDIISCIENELKISKNIELNILRRVVSLRNYFDMTKLNDSIEYSILSSLLHLKQTPSDKGGSPFDNEAYLSAITNIREFIHDFDYQKFYDQLSNTASLKLIFDTGESADKLYATRILLTLKPSLKNNKVLLKYLNESFHSENTLFYDLDSSKFELIPPYIIDSCTELFANIEE